MKSIARWALLICFIVAALLYLNSALYSAWLSGGPPMDYPAAWAQHSIKLLGYSVALLSTGIMAFIALGKKFSFRKSKFKYVWAIIILLSFGYPMAREFMISDKCLDAGGAWDSAHFECKH